MAILPIITGAENPILRIKAKPVGEITKKIQRLAADMKSTMLKAKGVGIAAPQVNSDLRIIICRFQAEQKDEKTITMINPEITWFSTDTTIEEEGCLSLPKVFGKVERPKAIHVNFFDEKAKEHIMALTDFNARIVQHEVDHLNGILFIDYLKDSHQ